MQTDVTIHKQSAASRLCKAGKDFSLHGQKAVMLLVLQCTFWDETCGAATNFCSRKPWTMQAADRQVSADLQGVVTENTNMSFQESLLAQQQVSSTHATSHSLTSTCSTKG